MTDPIRPFHRCGNGWRACHGRDTSASVGGGRLSWRCARQRQPGRVSDLDGRAGDTAGPAGRITCSRASRLAEVEERRSARDSTPRRRSLESVLIARPFDGSIGLCPYNFSADMATVAVIKPNVPKAHAELLADSQSRCTRCCNNLYSSEIPSTRAGLAQGSCDRRRSSRCVIAGLVLPRQ